MKRVLVVYDVAGWSWHRMCRGIQKFAPPEYEVDIVSQAEFGKFNSDKTHLSRYDAISQCSWAESSTGIPFDGKQTTWIAAHGVEHEYPCVGGDYRGRIVTRIRNRDAAAARIPNFDGVLCVSNRLYDVASELFDNVYRVRPGIDTDVFKPIHRKSNEVMTVGWSGQSKGRTKGYSEVLEPLIDSDVGRLINWRVNTKSAGDCLSRDEMVLWYNSLDVYLSTSFSEGFQMTIPEAMSCGIPVIATDCGGVPECISDGVSGFIVPGYHDQQSAVNAVDYIEKLLENRVDELQQMRKACRSVAVSQFSWKMRSEEWLSAMVR